MKYLFFLSLLSLPLLSFAQHEHDQQHSDADHQQHDKWRIALAISQSYIPSYHLHEEEASAQFIPTDGIEIQYYFSHKFSIRWINEIEFQTYFLKDGNGEHRVRENAFLTALVVEYEHNNWGVFAGGGYEFEKNENLWVVRTGVEYIFQVTDKLDITPAIIYDYKAESHTALTFALTIGHRF